MVAALFFGFFQTIFTSFKKKISIKVNIWSAANQLYYFIFCCKQSQHPVWLRRQLILGGVIFLERWTSTYLYIFTLIFTWWSCQKHFSCPRVSPLWMEDQQRYFWTSALSMWVVLDTLADLDWLDRQIKANLQLRLFK